MTETREIKVNGRAVTVGTELTIRGWRGRYKFQYAKLDDDGQVAEVVVFGGTPKGAQLYRSCLPSRIRTVHRVAKGRP